MKESGLWYLPYSEKKVPGKLFINDSKTNIILKLYAPAYLSGNAFGFGDRNRNDDYLEIILGDTSQRKFGDITLFGCSFAKLAPIAGKLYELHYRVQFIFNYIHVLERKYLKFNHVEVLYPNSDNFYNGWESINSDDENSIKEYKKVTNKIKINDDLSIDIVDSKRQTISLSRDYEIKHTNLLTFNYNKAIDIDDIYRDCVILQKMMEFSSHKKLTFIIKSAKIYFENIENQYQNVNQIDTEKKIMAHTYIYSRLTLNQEPFENKSKLNQNWMLYSGWTESNHSLSELIRNWFKNENLHPIYDFYIDTINWGTEGPISNVNFNNRYLNLMQGLEAYYDYLKPEFKYENETFVAERQKVFDALESEELKRWVEYHLKFPKQANFIDKLRFLTKKYLNVLMYLKSNSKLIESYPYKAKEYRNKLSHGKINKTFQGKNLSALYEFSQVLLCICILDSIGMEHKKIANRINSNPDINRQIPR